LLGQQVLTETLASRLLKVLTPAVDAGKSTLIKMLIEYQEYSADPQADRIPSPVVGASVHDAYYVQIYTISDPNLGRPLPILYARLRSLNAGETEPMGGMEKVKIGCENCFNRITNPLRVLHNGPEKPDQFAVTKLYQGYYILSSCCVFCPLRMQSTFKALMIQEVLNFVRTFQSLQLLLIGVSSLEKICQPASSTSRNNCRHATEKT